MSDGETKQTVKDTTVIVDLLDTDVDDEESIASVVSLQVNASSRYGLKREETSARREPSCISVNSVESLTIAETNSSGTASGAPATQRQRMFSATVGNTASQRDKTPPGGISRFLLEEAIAFSSATTANSHSHIDPNMRYIGQGIGSKGYSDSSSLRSYDSLLADATSHMMEAAHATIGESKAQCIQPLVRQITTHDDEADRLTAQTLGGLGGPGRVLRTLREVKKRERGDETDIAGRSASARGNDFHFANEIEHAQPSLHAHASTSSIGASVPATKRGSFDDVRNVFHASHSHVVDPAITAALDVHGLRSPIAGSGFPSPNTAPYSRKSFDIGVTSYANDLRGLGGPRNPYIHVASTSATRGPTQPRSIQLTPSSLMAVLSGNASLRDQRPKIQYSPSVQQAMSRLEEKGVKWIRHIDGRIYDRRSVFEASAAYLPNLSQQDVKDFTLMISNMPDIFQGLGITAGMRDAEAEAYVARSGDVMAMGSGFVRTYGPAAHPAMFAFSRDGFAEETSAATGESSQRRGGHMQRMLPSTEGYDDNGEVGAGTRILGVCQRMELKGWVVVVSRWYGGVLLGPARFQHIQNVASACVQVAKVQFGN